MSESRLFFTGNTLEQAVMSAARHYAVEPDELAYEKIERKTGFLRQRRRVVIRVDPERPRQEATAVVDTADSKGAGVGGVADDGVLDTDAAGVHREEEIAAEAAAPEGDSGDDQTHDDEAPPEAPASPIEAAEVPDERPRGRGRRRAALDDEEDGDDEVENAVAPARVREARGRGRASAKDEIEESAAAATVEEEEVDEAPRELPVAEGAAAEAAADCAVQLAKLADLELEIEVYQGEEQLEVELSGTDQELLVRGEGRLLLSIQHLLPRLMQSELGEMCPCRVDSGGFRDRRVASLRRLAKRTAEEVKRRHRSRTLRSMSPADRRTVHLTLKDVDGVETESAGDGFYKRITVRPT